MGDSSGNLRYPRPSLGSQSYAPKLCKCFAMSFPPRASSLGCHWQGAVWMETSVCRNCSSVLSSQPKGLSALPSSLASASLGGLISLLHWPGRSIVLTLSQAWHSPTGTDRCPGMGGHLLRCIDALETRCSNWTHGIVTRARLANVIELKRGVSEGNTVFGLLWQDSGERLSLNSSFSVIQVSFPLF